MVANLVDVGEREQRLDEVLGAYFQSVDAGQDLDLGRLIARHPDLADDLVEFFAEQDRFHRLIEPLRSETRSLAPPAGETPTEPYHELTAPPRVGPDGAFGDYVLYSEIGRGGMGVVYW